MTTSIVALALAGAGTYALRAGSVRLFTTRAAPARVGRALRHAAVGVMCALTITGLDGRPSVAEVTAPQALGLLAAVVVARRTSNIATVIATGIAAYAAAGALV